MGATSSKQNVVYTKGRKPEMKKNVDYFDPTFRVAWLIGIEQYTNVKKTDGTAIYTNVAQSKLDIENMKSLVNELKFNQVITTIDASCKKEM